MSNMHIKPTQKIVFINNKGGVGKTTMAYNTACSLSDQGYKTLLIDADPQCNLTLLALGAYKYQDLGLFQNNTIYNIISNFIELSGDINIIPPTNIRNNLDILPGNLNFSIFDDVLSSAYSDINLDGTRKRGMMIISALKRYIDNISIKNGYDIVIIDVSPSVTGYLNKTILLSADFFVTICNPDIFSTQGIMNLGNRIKSWREEMINITNSAKRDSNIPAGYLVDGSNSFMGYIQNNYNVYSQSVIKDHDVIFRDLKPVITSSLSELSKNGLVNYSNEKPLGTLQDYGKLSSISQQKNKPIFEITNDEAGPIGSIELLDKSKSQIEELSKNIIYILNKWGV